MSIAEATKTISVVIVGVGGQGILLASEIIAQAAVNAGYDVKTNEVHGMAQRGGSVVAQIRYGEKVHSPLVAKGTASVLGSLERTECLRYIDYLAPDGLAVVSSQKIIPVTVSSGSTTYPNIEAEELRQYFPNLIYVEAVEKAAGLGNARAANTILLGATSTRLDLPISAWETAIRNCVKPKFVDVNLKAFKLGRNSA
ncbi:MAG: indolepyruvate oxidoreductase subunit beta [Planctomycetaceae bacterium]|jgi:indolepyruvate ferredoxin oxidoreductase beta subunit|nr:indolepyruvate oxidoreductase subunit beta [Planctomycetaceae bacterium]